MTKMLDRSELELMSRHAMAHAAAGTIEQADNVLKIPALNYYDPERFQREVDRIFKRLPLMLAASAEMPNPGDYRALEAVGVPVLIIRGQDGVVRAFVNSCSHRGTNVAVEESGNTRRFTCPYHGWTFSQQGALIGISAPHEFGEIDRSCYGLTALPVLERAGLIWVVLDPTSNTDVAAFLSGYDQLLAHFGFTDWHVFSKRTIRGPNWKIAYDGYLDFYHLPVLHKNTFGDLPNQALYYAWGPHQRLQAPATAAAALSGRTEADWAVRSMLGGVWTIFPHISIASFDGGGRGVMVSQLMPGTSVGESFTTQIYLMEKPPTGEQAAEAEKQFKLLEYVVQEEDYATGLRQQKALEGGGRDHVLFGRNEGGAQRFHQWVDRVLTTEDADLNALFSASQE